MAELSSALILPAPMEDIAYLILEHAKQITGSRFGYVGYVDPYTGHLVCPTMTRDIWETCEVPDKTFTFETFGGLWGWVLENRQPLLTNDPDDDPRSTGVPEGHIAIRRFLSAPALIGDKLVGQIALANANADYEEQDLTLVQRLAALFALAIQRQQAEEERARAEKARRREMRSLEQLSGSPQAGLTAEMFGLSPLRGSRPDVFADLIQQYEQILEQSLEQKVYRVAHPISDRLQAIAEQLGRARAGPRDVVEIHMTALKNKGRGAPLAKAQAYAEEGRLRIVELMGYLTSYYRNHCLGSHVMHKRDVARKEQAHG